MPFFIISGLFLVVIGLVMVLIHSPTWPTGITLIAVGLVSVIYVTWRVLKEGLLTKWFIIILYLLMVPKLIETIIYGNQVMPMFEGLYRFANWLARLF